MRFLDSWFGKKSVSPEDGNPALVRAMHEVATSDNAETRKQLYEALLASMLLIPVQELPSGLGAGMHTLQAGVKLPLFSSLDREQVRFTVAFTDLEALKNWDPNTPYIGLKAQDFFSSVSGTDIQDILLNPFDPIRKMMRPGGRVKRAELEQLARGVVPINAGHQQFRVKANEQVFIGRPANPPSVEVQQALRAKASDIPAVAELYFFQMATKGGRSSTVVGIGLSEDVAEQQKGPIISALGKAFQAKMKSGEFLDFMFLSGSFGQQVRNVGGLIFRR
jgi:hypothetical protein